MPFSARGPGARDVLRSRAPAERCERRAYGVAGAGFGPWAATSV